MTIFIKNMVCVRCKMAVETVLEQLHIKYLSVELGKAKLADEITGEQMAELDISLRKYELELMGDKKKILIERIKTSIIELFQPHKVEIPLKLSVYLSEKLGYDYTYLSNTFSDMEGSTIERYFIDSRIERVKELIVYEKLTISEIAFQLNFSSASHLSLQFKKVTGHTPTKFKSLSESDAYAWRTCK